MKECPQCYKTKQRTDEEYKALVNRLNRIEGQIRGIKGMLEKNAYCPDILIQVAAANAALNSFNKELLANHIKTCVAQDIRDGKNETIDELVTVRPVHSQRFQLFDLGVGQHTFFISGTLTAQPDAQRHAVRRDILDGNFQRVIFQIILDGGGIALLPEDAAGVPHHAQCLEAFDAV